MSPRRKITVILALTVGFLSIAACALLWARRLPRDLRYLERIAGFRFPQGTFPIEIIRPNEFCVSGRLAVPPEKAMRFTATAGFKPATSLRVLAEFGINKHLFAATEPTEELLQLSGRSKTHRWELAYSQSRNELWFVLLFPDAHGDAPP